MSGDLLRIEDLRVDLPGPSGHRSVLRGVSLRMAPGEALGLVGESGSGKSMTARSVLRLLPRGARTTGAIHVGGVEVGGLDSGGLRRLRSRDVAMVFQDPRATVNPVRTVGDFLGEVLREQGLSRAAADAKAGRILAEIGVDRVERRLRQHPYELSGGLLQRVVIAAALATEPALILADEPTTALDVTTQEEVVAILDEQRRLRSVGLLFISHDLELAAAVCDRIAVMYAGTIVEVLPADRLHEDARHPYTQALLRARPGSVPPGARLETVPGRPQSAFDAPPTCVFADRCPAVADVCRVAVPEFRAVGTGEVACHLVSAEVVHG
ncbi:ABC transporter ATP-binding protein [Cryptosporangium aurantiacum]|uniref:Oligopeptide/dipeptide ABC transporter, ATP-binding protein, C-terminal domain-containing protein n=1 Tax=Cryptosporangium aurantiacum TaxID=134849 RepID=A0A1M7PRS9_9ACTN|nr:ABC transporter ATP-binding protein [Cryptosporangium aurantiacum]SHN20099.1 oligopeptide/dipeptide ABC transporter, ATP-binding protein, C-terminal domain-containing protein [Cryptosporangium aurantiacum]